MRVRQSDLDAFVEAGAPPSPEPEVEPQVDEGSVTAWATFGAALAEASSRLDEADREKLISTLESLVAATQALVDVLGGAQAEQGP